MGRTMKDNRPNLPKVQRIDLSEKNPIRRFIIVIILITIASIAMANVVRGFMQRNKGWQVISPELSENANISKEIIFQYNLGLGDTDATTEKKALVSWYSPKADYFYQIFDVTEEYEDLVNLCTINKHPNEVLTIDETLYGFFEKLEAYDCRYIYQAPIHEYYDSALIATEDYEAKEYDGRYNEEIASEYSMLSAFIADPEMVRVELLGNNQIQLVVAEEYQKAMEEAVCQNYVDFSWLKNAFIVDALSEELIAKGYTHGNINSVDGYVRNLDALTDESFDLNVYVKAKGQAYEAASLTYQGAVAFVSLRNFNISAKESDFFYSYSDGKVSGRMLKLETGLSTDNENALLAMSQSKGCADLVLTIADTFMEEESDYSQVAADWLAKDISILYNEDYELICNAEYAKLTDFYDKDGIAFSVR